MRQQLLLLFWKKLLHEAWHLHPCFLRQSPTSSSEQDPPRKHALWATICDPYLYHISCTVRHFSVIWASCVPLLKGMPKPIFCGCVRLFTWCVHTLPKLQLQASTQPVTWFPECFRLHCSRLKPQHTVQRVQLAYQIMSPAPQHTVQRVQLVYQITPPRISSPLSLN